MSDNERISITLYEYSILNAETLSQKDTITRLNAEVERLRGLVVSREGELDIEREAISAAVRLHGEALSDNELMRAAILKVTEALNQGRIASRGGVSGMTIDAQLRNSVYNGVPAWPIEEAREMLDEINCRAALSAQPEQEKHP
jgi:hypothetical protein